MALFTANDVVVDFLSGAITGSTAYLWGLEIGSGSIDKQISYAEKYVRGKIGDSLYNDLSADWTTQSASTIQGDIQGAVMDYTCFRITVVLTRGIITNGFDYRVGPLAASRSRANISFFKDTAQLFRDEAMKKIDQLMPLGYSEDTVLDTSETPDWASDAAPGLY